MPRTEHGMKIDNKKPREFVCVYMCRFPTMYLHACTDERMTIAHAVRLVLSRTLRCAHLLAAAGMQRNYSRNSSWRDREYK